MSKENESIDIATWKPNHPQGTTYTADWEKGTVVANLPDGTKELYKIGEK